MTTADTLRASVRRIRETRAHLEGAYYTGDAEDRLRVAAECAVLERSEDRLKHAARRASALGWRRFIRLTQSIENESTP
jgi:hypothetical protein